MFFCPQPLGIYHVVDNVDTLHVRKPNKELSKKRAIAMDIFIAEFRDDLEKYCPYMLGTYVYGTGVGLLLSGMKKKSRSLFFISFRYGYKRIFDLFFIFLSFLPFSTFFLSVGFKVKLFFFSYRRR